MSEVILYTTDDGRTRIDLRLEDGTVWLSQLQIAELFQTTKQNVSKHIKAIYDDHELEEVATVNQQLTVQKEGAREVSRTLTLYNLDVILAVGYRVRSPRGVQFRRYASSVLKEYLEKGFVLNDERLKNLGGGNYWKELLDRIRDIRSSEKVMYRQVLDLYATASDYDPNSDQSIQFFKIVQNKLHYAAHGHTASEVLYLRVDSDKPFAGLSNFKGEQPTQAEAMIAKNYLSASELRVLNNLVSAYSKPTRAPTASTTPRRRSAISSPSAIWNRRPLMRLRYSAMPTPRTSFWRRATRNTWKVSPRWLRVRRGEVLSKSSRS